jgi:hypothetical protein
MRLLFFGRYTARPCPENLDGALGATAALCGRVFVIVLPERAQETERDRLCPECAALPPPPPEEPGGAGEL